MNAPIVALPTGRLTSAEHKIMAYIASHPGEFLAASIEGIARHLDLSAATISRFARHMGCRDFKDLKRTLVARGASAGCARKMEAAILEGDGGWLDLGLDSAVEYVERTRAHIDGDAFLKAARAIAEARRVFLYGKNASRPVADLLAYRLRRLGVDVTAIASAGTEMIEGLLSMREGDVAVLFALSKLSAEGRQMLLRAADVRAHTVVCTGAFDLDFPAEPVAKLFVYRGAPDVLHAMTSVVAVVEALAVAVGAQRGDRSAQSLETVESMKRSWRSESHR